MTPHCAHPPPQGPHPAVSPSLLPDYQSKNRLKSFFLTERIVYFLNTVHCYNILESTVIMKYKYIRRCVILLLKRVIVG
jgi:hypothetical protein